MSQAAAALGAATVCTYPFFVGMSRAFMSELPFCAFALSALACLCSGKAWGYTVFYFLAFLIRPFEALLLLPSYFLFFYRQNEPRLALKDFHVDAVVYSREILPGVLPFPNRAMVEILSKNQPSRLGLKLVRKIQWFGQGRTREIEVYGAE
ncbi:MAG: hypothetical protein AB7K68_00735 [Bacteriovoracia bacterium]